jgi:hypothetical protein
LKELAFDGFFCAWVTAGSQAAAKIGAEKQKRVRDFTL